MALGAHRQAALYYSRKRTRDARAVPRLFATAKVDAGASETVFDTDDYEMSVSFGLKIDLASSGALFSLGSTIEVTHTTSTITFRYKAGIITVPKPPSGKWDLVLAIRPDGEMRLWTPEGLAGAAKAVAGAWGSAGNALAAGAALCGPLVAYSCQLPRRFNGVTVIETQTDNLLFNSTAINFMAGFKTPLFES